LHFSTIPIHHNSSINGCLRLAPFLNWTTSVFSSTVTNAERRIPTKRTLLSILTCPPFRTSGEPKRDHHLEQFVVILCCPLPQECAHGTVAQQIDFRFCSLLFRLNRWCLPNYCPAMDYFSLSRKRVLVGRWLAMDYSGFQASAT
jgi:hypothetical protein